LVGRKFAGASSDWRSTCAKYQSGEVAIGQRHNGADTGGRHQAPAHLIIPDNGQQTAMQDDDLFAMRPPDNEHRLDQHRQVGEVLNKLP
jgi:hypothetical protein